MTRDLEPIRQRAMLIRNVTLPWAERSDAVLTASDDLLHMIDEVESMRKACSPQASRLAANIAAISMFPIETDSPRDDLVSAISQSIYQFAYDHRPKRGKAQTWDISAFHGAMSVLRLVDKYIKDTVEAPLMGQASGK